MTPTTILMLRTLAKSLKQTFQFRNGWPTCGLPHSWGTFNVTQKGNERGREGKTHRHRVRPVLAFPYLSPKKLEPHLSPRSSPTCRRGVVFLSPTRCRSLSPLSPFSRRGKSSVASARKREGRRPAALFRGGVSKTAFRFRGQRRSSSEFILYFCNTRSTIPWV